MFVPFVANRRVAHMRRAGAKLALCAAVWLSCGGGTETANDGGALRDDGGSSVDCDRNAPFGARVAMTALNTSDREEFPRLSPDELTIFFSRDRDVFMAKRATRNEPFNAPQDIPLGARIVSFSADLLTVYYSDREQISVKTRPSIDEPFGLATALDLGTGEDEWHPFLTADGSELWFNAAEKIYRAPVVDGAVRTPAPVTDLEPTAIDYAPMLTADGLELYFASSRSGTNNFDIFAARRASRTDPFDAPTLVVELSVAGMLDREYPGWMSPNGCRMYYSAGSDLYYADRP